MTTKYYVRVAIPYDIQKQSSPTFHNFVEWLDQKEGQLRCCDDVGVFSLYDTYKEAEAIAKQISEFFYITEVKEYVT